MVDRYYREHQAELDELDERIRQRTEERVRRQRQDFPEWQGTPADHVARLKELLDPRRQEKNGAGHPG